MNRFRNSTLSRIFIFLMTMSIFLVSCDPNNHYLTEQKIDQSLSELASNFNSGIDCTNMEQYIRKGLNFVRANHLRGIHTTEEALLTYIIDEAKKNGEEGTNITWDQINIIAEKMKSLNYVTTSGSVNDLLSTLVENGEFSMPEKSFIIEMENKLSTVSKDNAISVIEEMKLKLNNISDITTDRKSMFSISLDMLKKVACTNNVSESIIKDGLDGDRCSITVCVEERRYELQYSLLAVTVLSILAIIFLGPLGVAISTIVWITVATWVLVIVVICYVLPCPEEDPCPDGQNPFCGSGFTLVNGWCCSAFLNSVEGTGLFANNTGTCPPGTIDLGNGKCFFGTLSGLGIDPAWGVQIYNDQCGGFLGHKPDCR